MKSPMDGGHGEGEAPGRNYYYLNPDALLPRPAPRRTKRLVPDTEKDNRYWEKRKRNNDAARRSRENKRRLDVDIRSRVVILEEESALLKKELTVIKSKFGLPLDQRFLTVDSHNGELVASPITPFIPPQFPEDSGNHSSSSSSSGGQPKSDIKLPVLSIGNDIGHHHSVNVPHNHANPIAEAVRTSVQSQHPEIMDNLSSMPVKKRRREQHEDDMDPESPRMSPSPDMRASSASYYPSGPAYPSQMMWTSNQAQFYAPLQMPTATSLTTALSLAAQENGRSQTLQQSHQRPPHPHVPSAPQDSQRLPSINAFGGHSKEEKPTNGGGILFSQSYQSETSGVTTTTSASIPTPRRSYYVDYNGRDGQVLVDRSPADLTTSRSRELDTHDNQKSSHYEQHLALLESAESLLSMNNMARKQMMKHDRFESETTSQPSQLSPHSLERENNDIRSQLQVLSAEVAKMKNFVMKDNPRSSDEREDDSQ